MTNERVREILATAMHAVLQRGLADPEKRRAIVERFGVASVARYEADVVTVAEIRQLIAELDRG
jgi:hypothetical protein